jgi:hypothetical protein
MFEEGLLGTTAIARMKPFPLPKDAFCGRRLLSV